MPRKVVVYLLLLIFFSLPLGNVRSGERHFWAICVDNDVLGGYELGREVKQSLVAGGWNSDHIRVVEENSSDALFNALGWLRNMAREGDVILFYFSGHGYDGGIDMGTYKISYDELNGELNEITCKGMFIVLDACHSGSAVPILGGENRIIIASCHADETSGYFSEPLINAMGVAADCNGNLDGSVSAEEIFSYVMDDWHVETYTPQIGDGYEGNLSILSAHREGQRVDVFQVHAQKSVENLGGAKWLRQSFVPASTPILGISLKIARWKDATDARIEIYDKNCSFMGGTNFSVENAKDIDNIPLWISADMHIDVVPEERYFLVCRSNSTWWWWGGGDWYGDGEASISYDGGNFWQADAEISDFSFIVYGEEDKIPPDVSLVYPKGKEILSGMIPVSWSAADNNDGNLDGSITISLSSDNGKTWDIIAEGIENNGIYVLNTTQMEDGHYMIKVTAVDDSSNEGDDISDETFVVDNTPPETTCDIYGQMGKHGWHVNKTTIVISAYDSLSDVSIYYKVDGGSQKKYTRPLILSKDGEHEFSYHGEDAAGNAEKRKETIIKVDCTRPNVSFLVPEEKYLYVDGRKIIPLPKNTILVGRMAIKVRAEDEISGISNVKFFRDEEQIFIDRDEPYEWEWSSSFFKHKIKCIVYDNAGNHAHVQQIIFFLAL